jgi:hypothetical protein
VFFSCAVCEKIKREKKKIKNWCNQFEEKKRLNVIKSLKAWNNLSNQFIGKSNKSAKFFLRKVNENVERRKKKYIKVHSFSFRLSNEQLDLKHHKKKITFTTETKPTVELKKKGELLCA